MTESRLGRPRIEGTGRLEALSDGVVAIVVTLLVLELRLPEVQGHDPAAYAAAFAAVGPKFLSFIVSFVTVTIFWVNHHHFMTGVTHTDWKLLWLNSLLLFFLCITPFTTAVLGDHPTDSVPVAVYGLNLGLAGLAFALMGRYVLFVGRLVPESVPEAERASEFRRSVIGSIVYLIAGGLGFIAPVVSLVLFVVVPITFVVPTLFGRSGDRSEL